MNFCNQPEVNPREGTCPSFDPNDVRKVNTVISLRPRKKVSTHVGEHDVDVFPPYFLPILLLRNVFFMICLLLSLVHFLLTMWKTLRMMSLRLLLTVHVLRLLLLLP